MKKNKMMRLASGLLVAVLLTTSMISGTFAKYVTSAEGSDTARVAKWGVEVAVTGNLFDTSYDEKDDGNEAHTDGNTITVKAVDSKSVAAPGTTDTDGLTFYITGKPEVATDVKIVFDVKDIFLKEGTYQDLTTGTSTSTEDGEKTITGDTDEFTVGAENYYPIKYTLVHTTTSGPVTKTGTLADIKTYLEALSDTFVEPMEAGKDLKDVYGTFKLTWDWAFEANNQADTFLSNLAAGTTTAAADAYNLEASFDLDITVTQVD